MGIDYVHICLLFNLFIKHFYIPIAFMQSIGLIIPLVKSKSGNLSDKDNYRAVAIFLRQYQKCLSQ